MNACHIQIRVLALLIAWLVFVPAPAVCADAESGDVKPVSYKAVVEGVDDDAARELIESVSDAFAQENNPPATRSLLLRRMENDVDTILKALRSSGFFKATVKTEIRDEEKPVQAVFVVETGPAFTYSTIEIRGPNGEPGEKYELPVPEELGLFVGASFRASDVLSADKVILEMMGREGHPYPEITNRKIIADHARDVVELAYTVNPGPRARFGQTSVSGLDRVDEPYLLNRIPWVTGQRFDSALLTRARSSLIKTGLFSTVNVNKGKLDEKSVLPITIEVKERYHRTVKAGVGYTTDTGFEFNLGWTHRNYFGSGENLDLSLSVSEITREFGAVFKKPDFLSPKQMLILDYSFASQNTIAFDTLEQDVSGTVERVIGDYTVAGLGAKYRLSIVEEGDDEEVFGLVGFPAYLRLDTTDDLLDPSEGGRLRLSFEPFVDTLGNDVHFFRSMGTYSHYLEMINKKRLIFAATATVGSIWGTDLNQVPDNERFYAGGGGSVRGYAYQTAGDLVESEPVGGLSIVEVSGEMRFKIASFFGMAMFLDGGRAFPNHEMDFEQDLFWGAGLGLRYYTPIGPLRLDVGFPLDRREGIDDEFQIYVSLGQSF